MLNVCQACKGNPEEGNRITSYKGICLCDRCLDKFNNPDHRADDYVLRFDKPPKLIFVSEEGKGFGDKLYIDGKEVKGTKEIRIYSQYDEPTTHEVEYLTCKSKG